MKVFRQSMDVDDIQNVEKMISAELQKKNKEKYKLIAIDYRYVGDSKQKRLVMDFVHVPNEAVKNFVNQVSIKKHPKVKEDPDEFAGMIKCPNGQKYIGNICPKPEKHYLFFFA